MPRPKGSKNKTTGTAKKAAKKTAPKKAAKKAAKKSSSKKAAKKTVKKKAGGATSNFDETDRRRPPSLSSDEIEEDYSDMDEVDDEIEEEEDDK
jgi:RNA polymerase primary sigma factor